MKKSIIICAALLALVSCKKNETEVKGENTVIEGPKDTTHINTDTDSAKAETPVETETAQTPEAPVEAIKDDKGIKPYADDRALIAAVDYASFGDKITADKALTKEQMLKKYSSLK
jgi:hypothetical protein